MQSLAIDYLKDYVEMQPSVTRESENLELLFSSIFSAIDVQQQDLLWLSQNILNLDLAQGWHLDFIGGIVGQSRILADFGSDIYFGFENSYKSETFGSRLGENIGGYWNSRSYFNSSTSRKLSDNEYRRLIKARVIYNQSNCITNDLLEVINLITGNTNSVIQRIKHGYINIKVSDETGLLSYFVDRLNNEDNILPIAAGVRVILDNLNANATTIVILANLLEKLVNEDLPLGINE